MAEANLEEEVIEEEVSEEVESEETENTETEIEAWMADDDESDQTDANVMPVHAHIKKKRKLQGQISEQKDEISELKDEIAKLKSGPVQQKAVELPKRPKEADFDTDEEYHVALEKYDDERIEARFKLRDSQTQMQTTQSKQVEAVKKDVDAHYERANALIEKNGISPEVYQQADKTVRESVEAIAPGRGDSIVDQAISVLGDDSEKVMYKLGRSKGLLGQFIALMVENPVKASVFLGEQKAKLLNTKVRKSNAPPPDVEVNGDDTPNAKSGVYKRKYDAASKKSPQEAYNIRKEARNAGVDVSSW